MGNNPALSRNPFFEPFPYDQPYKSWKDELKRDFRDLYANYDAINSDWFYYQKRPTTIEERVEKVFEALVTHLIPFYDWFWIFFNYFNMTIDYFL